MIVPVGYNVGEGMLAASTLAFAQTEIGVPNMYKRDDITPDILRQLLRYDPDTGKLFWKERDVRWFASDGSCRSWNSKFSGSLALNTDDRNGYRHGEVFNITFKAHVAAWAICKGAFPTFQIDHIDGDGHNNRISNLRDVDRVTNCRNKGINSNNTSGVVGVSFDSSRGVWKASIGRDGKSIHIGWFKGFDDAVAARKNAEADLGYHPNHGRMKKD
jgi:hypothetical protein